jgi:small subunit ribosomal protein S20
MMSREVLVEVPFLANIKSSIKDIERNRKRRMRNRAIKSRVRTYIRKFREAVESGDKQLAMEAYKAAQSQIDRAVSKGVLKRNTGSRYKSRLAARLVAM